VRKIAVFDTNILFSAVGWRGKPFQCIELARSGAIDAAASRELLDEFAGKLQTKLTFSAQQALDAVADLLSFMRVVPITGQVRVVAADPDDDKVLECALVAHATHIVTGDRRHLLPLGKFQGIPIVSAADFVAEVSGS
jgi:putative PIN family toxin of toxin-antitoxin system